MSFLTSLLLTHNDKEARQSREVLKSILPEYRDGGIIKETVSVPNDAGYFDTVSHSVDAREHTAISGLLKLYHDGEELRNADQRKWAAMNDTVAVRQAAVDDAVKRGKSYTRSTYNAEGTGHGEPVRVGMATRLTSLAEDGNKTPSARLAQLDMIRRAPVSDRLGKSELRALSLTKDTLRTLETREGMTLPEAIITRFQAAMAQLHASRLWTDLEHGRPPVQGLFR